MEQIKIPLAIILAGIIVAVAILLNGAQGEAVVVGVERVEQESHSFGNNNSQTAVNVRAIDETDHIFGNPDAEVFIIEYSDFECPFCARLHPTLKRVVETYDGKVAWVYRHFPLTSIHSRAERAAVASECIAELGGNDAFWEFTDILFANQRGLGDDLYLNSLQQFGINEAAFLSCMTETKQSARVAADLQNAVASGGRGTPFSVILDGEGGAFPFAGALSYEQISGIVNQALNQ